MLLLISFENQQIWKNFFRIFNIAKTKKILHFAKIVVALQERNQKILVGNAVLHCIGPGWVLTKYKDVRPDPEKNVNKAIITNVSVSAEIVVWGIWFSKIFWGGEAPNFDIFFKSSFFPAELIWNKLRNKNGSREFGVCSHDKFLKIYRTIILISPSRNMMHLVRTLWFMRASKA